MKTKMLYYNKQNKALFCASQSAESTTKNANKQTKFGHAVLILITQMYKRKTHISSSVINKNCKFPEQAAVGHRANTLPVSVFH